MWGMVVLRVQELLGRGDVWGLIILALVLWWARYRVPGPAAIRRIATRTLSLGALLSLIYALLLTAETLLGLDMKALFRVGGRLLLVVLLGYASWELLETGVIYAIGRIPVRDEFQERRLHTAQSLTLWVGRVVLLFIAIAMILDIFQVNIAPLVAGAGVVGLALGLGSQKLMQDIIAGLFILVEDQFRVGDSVQVAGVAGTVEGMSLRATKVRDFNGVLHFIPNSEITQVANRTRAWARAIAEVGVSYESNLAQVESTLIQVGRALYEENPDNMFLEQPFPLGPEALGDSAITFRLVARVRPGKQWDAQRLMRRRIKEAFDAANITIPFPQMDVHLKQGE